eukprot:COSAG01_NODE_17_length_39991_cov_30.596160_6_plen_45_part_00
MLVSPPLLTTPLWPAVSWLLPPRRELVTDLLFALGLPNSAYFLS